MQAAVVRDVFALRAGLLLGGGPPSAAGFLVGTLRPEALVAMLADGARLHTRYESGLLVGYMIVCPVRYLTGLFFDRCGGEYVPDAAVEFAEYEFLYQIAVDAGAGRRGVGSAMLREHLDRDGRGLVVDVVIQPHRNDASLGFFRKHGFREVGTLRLAAYDDAGPITTRVLALERRP